MAAAIAAILAGAVVVTNVEAAIEEILGVTIAPVAVGLDPDVSSAIARSGARLATEGGGGGSIQRGGAGNPVAAARLNNLLRRAHYVLEATRRVVRDVVKGKTLTEALTKEGAFFQAHRTAQGKRTAAAEMASAAQSMWGDTVTWHHSGKEDYRPSHKRADGKQFSLTSPPASTGGLPGTLPNCECYVGPPDPSAKSVE